MQPATQARALIAGQEVRLDGQTRYGVGNATWTGVPRIVSWKPMATVYDNFLTEEECDYILDMARPLMEPAMLVNSEVQQHRKSKSRTSHGAFMDSFQDPVLAMITQRIGHVTRIPPRAISRLLCQIVICINICQSRLLVTSICLLWCLLEWFWCLTATIHR
jgi:hypothetical protein